jgi:periplasmic copper chaperone A
LTDPGKAPSVPGRGTTGLHLRAMRRFALLLLAAALVWPTHAFAHSHKAKGLEIIHPWTRAMLDKAQTTVLVSMTIKNSGAGDRLLGASTALAATADIRAPGQTKALPSVAIGAGKRVELKRKGPHLLLTGFTKQLHAYETFAMTLVFEQAGSVVIEVMVEEAEAEPKPKRR